MRTFVLYRHEDVSGVSGTGIVAEGTAFSNGKVAVAWGGRANAPSVIVYNSVADVEKVHGHDGKTEIQWDAGASDR